MCVRLETGLVIFVMPVSCAEIRRAMLQVQASVAAGSLLASIGAGNTSGVLCIWVSLLYAAVGGVQILAALLVSNADVKTNDPWRLVRVKIVRETSGLNQLVTP